MSARCEAKVAEEGRMMGFHQCMNKPKPGSPFCGIHAPKVKPEPTMGGAPTVEVQQVRRVTIRLAWKPDQAPVFAEPYTVRPIIWHTWQASVDLAEDGSWEERYVSLNGWGCVQKKDGTPSEKLVSPRFMRLAELPDPLADLIRAELKKAVR